MEGKVQLKSSDDEIFEVDEAVAFESETMRHMIEDTGTNNVLPLLNVTGQILAKVIEYCKYHVEAKATQTREEKAAILEEDVKKWDEEFLKVDLPTIFSLVLAANYLNIKNVMDLMCQTVADMIKGKIPVEIQKIFNIKNDFIPEEEEEIRCENQWAFE